MSTKIKIKINGNYQIMVTPYVMPNENEFHCTHFPSRKKKKHYEF